MATNGRVIVGCTPGEEDPDRVLVAYLTAGAALDQGKEVVMWLTAKGVRLALNGYGERIRADQDPPVKRVHAQFIDKGGRFYVCPICFNERHLDQDDLGGLQVRRQPAAAQGVGRRHGDPQRPPSGGPTAPPRAASRPTSSPPRAATRTLLPRPGVRHVYVPAGDLVVEGVTDDKREQEPFAIAGGTGAYAGARGVLTGTETNTETRFHFAFQP